MLKEMGEEEGSKERRKKEIKNRKREKISLSTRFYL